jgi:DNA-binding NarL/FixJ family response regulator
MTIRVVLVFHPSIAWEGLRPLIENHPDMQLIAQASDIRSASKLAQRHQPDVVVMDINQPLPEIIQSAQEMIRHVPAVKIITISMQTDRAYAEKSFLAGISGFIVKECAYEELVPAIHHVMAGQTYLSPDVRLHAF